MMLLGVHEGGGGGRGGRFSEPFVLIVLLVLTYSVRRKVRIPRPFCLRLHWDAQAALCMTSSDLALKVYAFPPLPLHHMEENS